MKRLICLLAVLAFSFLLLPGALSEDWKIPPKEPEKVFFEGETEPFAENAELLTLRVCPLQGADCMLLTLGEHTMLVDTGRPTQAAQVQGMLKSLGLSSVEYVFNTHPHSDHIGGVIPLLDAGFGIGTFITLFPHQYIENVLDYDYFGETLRALDRAGVPVLDLKTEDKIPFGDAELTLMRIPDKYLYDGLTCNEMAAMLMVRFGDCSVLLTADVEPSTDSQILLTNLYDLKTDILKYPHHGLSIMAADMLRETDPEYTFFTHGAGNTRDAQALLIHNGLTRMSFATWGMITMQTDGTKWIVRQDILPEMQEIADTYTWPE